MLVLLLILLIRPRLASRILQWNSVPLTIYPVSPLPIMIRCADSPTLRGGKAPNQPNDDLL